MQAWPLEFTEQVQSLQGEIVYKKKMFSLYVVVLFVYQGTKSDKGRSTEAASIVAWRGRGIPTNTWAQV